MAATDIYTAPATKGRVITKNDSTIVDCRAVYVGGAGDLNVQLSDDADGTTTLFSTVPAGMFMPISCRRIYSTSTTATLIVALY